MSGGFSASSGAAGLERNVRLYHWYAAAFNAFFWMPVFFLYFSAQFSLENVLRLEAVYYAAVVLLEVPSGYFSDVHGRRKTLLVSSAALVFAYALFFFGGGFTAFAAAQVFLAAGISFNSGTDVSFHYDSLAALGREGEFGEREARVARNAFLAGGGSALLGGLAAALQLRFAYGLSLLAALVTLGISAAAAEPPAGRESTPAGGILRQIGTCVGLLRGRVLRWLFGFSVLMTVVNHVPYEFYQPYLGLLAFELDLPARGTPAAAGFHVAATMLLGAWFAARSVRLEGRIGVGGLLLFTAFSQIAVIAVMGTILHPWVAALILFRSVPRALMTAPLNAAIAPRVHQAQRATYLSIQSLAGRLVFSAMLFLLSLAAGAGAAPDWPALSLMQSLSAGLALAGALGLAATVRVLRRGDR